MRAESGVAASDAGTLDLPDCEGDLFVRRIGGREGLQDLEGDRPAGLAVSAEHQGGLQHSGLPVVGSDSEDIVDRRGGVVVGPRDLRTILELLVVVDLATKQVLTTRLPGAVRETNRPCQVDDRVHFPSGRILRLFRLRFLGETRGRWSSYPCRAARSWSQTAACWNSGLTSRSTALGT